MTLTEEIWMPIPGVPYYQASSLGRIRSTAKWVRLSGAWRVKPGKILKPRLNTTDRYQVGVYLDNEQVQKGVHVLVCSAFNGPCPDDKPWALHRNGDHHDNRPENPYWGDPADNAQDMIRHGNHVEARKTHCVRGHEYTEENTYLRPDGNGRQCYECIKIRGKEQQARKKLAKSLSGDYEVFA